MTVVKMAGIHSSVFAQYCPAATANMHLVRSDGHLSVVFQCRIFLHVDTGSSP